LKGLPDDHCQSAHWGYLLKGRLTYRLSDHDEVIEAGDAFYVPPGHTLIGDAGSEVVFFSPTAEWHRTVDRIGTVPDAART
jgi:quercetin dioxygenase-like cupin family protein